MENQRLSSWSYLRINFAIYTTCLSLFLLFSDSRFDSYLCCYFSSIFFFSFCSFYLFLCLYVLLLPLVVLYYIRVWWKFEISYQFLEKFMRTISRYLDLPCPDRWTCIVVYDGFTMNDVFLFMFVFLRVTQQLRFVYLQGVSENGKLDHLTPALFFYSSLSLPLHPSTANLPFLRTRNNLTASEK